jgi:XapX domain-containing protein
MKPYVLSLAAGLIVGIVYSLLHVRTPAPPLIALVGLLGMLLGEQIIPLGKRLLEGGTISAETVRAECAEHVFGELPRRRAAAADALPPE